MDLPPPQAPPFSRPPDHRNIRYRNYIHPRDLTSPPFPHHLPPPPPSPHIVFPPSPPPPPIPAPGYMESHPFVANHFNFSPPRYSTVERSHPYECNRLPKPYLERDAFPLPISSRESLPLRLGRDYSEQSPRFTEEVYGGRFGNDFIERVPESLPWGVRDFGARVADAGAHERYSNVFACGREVFDEWHGEERWDDGINGRSCDWYNQRDGAESRWNSRFSGGRCELYEERDIDERRWDAGINTQGREIYDARNDVRGYGINHQGCEVRYEMDDDRRRRGYGINCDLYDLYNERDDIGLGRFSGRLGRLAGEEDFNRERKKRRVQKTRAIDKIELGTASRRRSRGYRYQHDSKGSSSSSSRWGKEEVELKRFDARMEDNIEREQSPVELAISFKSNALVAKAILPPSNPALKSDIDVMSENKNTVEVNIVHSSPLAKSCEKMVKTDVITCEPTDVLGISEERLEKNDVSQNGREVIHTAKNLGEIAVENENFKDIKSQGTNDVGSGQACVPRKRKKRKAKKKPFQKSSEELLEKIIVSENGSVNSSSTNHLADIAVRETLGDKKLQVVKTDALMPGNKNNMEANVVHGSPLAKPNEETVGTGILTCVSGNVHGMSKELLEKKAVSYDERVVMNNANDLAESAVVNGTYEDIKSQRAEKVRSGQTSVRRKRRAKGQTVIFGIGSANASGVTHVSGVSAANENSEDLKSQAANHNGAGLTRACRRRRKRKSQKQLLHNISLQTIIDSGKIMSNNINAPCAVPQLNTNANLIKTDEVPDTDILLFTGGTSSKKVDNDIDYDKPVHPILKRKRSTLTISQASLHAADSTSGFPLHMESSVALTKHSDYGCQLGNDEVAGCGVESCLANENTGDSLGLSRNADVVDICSCNRDSAVRLCKSENESINHFTSLCTDMVGFRDHPSHSNSWSSKIPQTEHPEIYVDEYLSEIQKSCSASEANCLQLGKPETVSVMDCENGNSKEILVSKVDTSQVCVDAVKIDNSEICQFTACPSKILRKRKAGDVLMDISCSETNDDQNTVGSNDGEDGEVLPKELSCAEEVEFPCVRNDKKGSSSEGLSGVADISGSGKKIKVVRSRLIPSLENDVMIDVTDHLDLNLEAPELLKWEAGQRENTHSAAPADPNEGGTADMVVQVGGDNLSVSDIDKSLASDDEMRVKHDLAVVSNLSFSADEYVANSGYELVTSDSDVPSCPSSPEDLLLFSDFSSPPNPRAAPSQVRSVLTNETERKLNPRPVSSVCNTFSLGKSLQRPTSCCAQTNNAIPQLTSQGTSKIAQNSSPIPGKLTFSKNHPISAIPKDVPGYSLNHSASRKFSSSPATKSRTWHRTGTASVVVSGPKLQPCPLPRSLAAIPPISTQNSYVRKGNSLVRKPSPSNVTSPGFSSLNPFVKKPSPSIDFVKKIQAFNSSIGGIDASSVQKLRLANTSKTSESLSLNHQSTTSNLRNPLPSTNTLRNGYPKTLNATDETIKSCASPEYQNGSGNSSDSQSTLDDGNLGKKLTYIKRRSNQLVAASDLDDTPKSSIDKTQASLSDGYYKSKKNQLIRASVKNNVTKGGATNDVNLRRLGSYALPPRSSIKRQLGKGSAKTYKSSKFSFVWKLQGDAQSSGNHKFAERPQKAWSRLFPWKRATYRRSLMLALGSKPNTNSFSTISQKLLLSRKRGAVYTRSTRGYSLRMSKVFSVGGSSLKWSKSIEKDSKKANEEATRAVAAAEKRKLEDKVAVSGVLKTRNHVSRERIFRIGSERYKMDQTRRTLQRITAEEKPSSSVGLPSEKIVKRSYVPRRFIIGNNEYVRIGNGNQLVRDPKKRTRVLASEKVRWSLHTARMRWTKKMRYCQFFTKFGKCNKDDGKCPYIHDRSKIVVCTKFLSGSCSNPDCKLTHKVIPERMQDCSYFLKGSCSNENCPYRHVDVDPNSSVCESFLRGYCADGNACPKKHTYVCPAFEATGTCAEASTCKLHHPKKKTEQKPTSEQKIVRGRYFDGGLIDFADCRLEDDISEVFAEGKDDVVLEKGKYPDYISLDVSDDEMEDASETKLACGDIIPDMKVSE